MNKKKQYEKLISVLLIQLSINMKKFKVDSIIIDSTNDFPNHGIADKRFVITVAPHKLI